MRRRDRFLLIVVATLVTVEVATRVAFTSKAFQDRIAGGSSEARRVVSLLRWKSKASDPTLATAPGARRLQHDPELGWTPRPGKHVIHGATATVNAEGRRVTPPGLPAAQRVALLGDSFTYGEEVEDQETFAWGLAERTPYRVVDYGVPSFGVDQMVLRLERDVLAEAPDVVVMAISSPMFIRSMAPWDAWMKPYFTLEDGQLVPHNTPVPPPAEVLDGLAELRIVDLARIWYDTLTHNLQDPIRIAALNEALLRRGQAAARDAGAVPVILWLPIPELVGNRRAARMPVALRVLCAEPEAFCVDPTARFRAAREQGVELVRGAHYSPEAHRLVAHALADALEVADLPRRSAADDPEHHADGSGGEGDQDAE